MDSKADEKLVNKGDSSLHRRKKLASGSPVCDSDAAWHSCVSGTEAKINSLVPASGRGEFAVSSSPSILGPVARPSEERLQRSIARRRKSETWPWGHGISARKLEQLQKAGDDPSSSLPFELRRAYDETSKRVDRFAREVRECKNVNEANDFARFILWTFVPLFDLIEDHRHVSLRARVQDLIAACCEHFRSGKAVEKYTQSDIARIDQKLDLVMSCVAKLAVTPSGAPQMLPLGSVVLNRSSELSDDERPNLPP